MTTKEITISEIRIAKQEVQPTSALMDFEIMLYESLLLSSSDKEHIQLYGEVFNASVRQRFPQSFFTEEDDYTAAEKMIKDLDFEKNWSKEIPKEQMEEGSKAFTNFCLHLIPILETSYPSVQNADPYAIGHRMITSSIISYSKLREKHEFTPLPLHKRTTMYYAICDALTEQENGDENNHL